jgi:hypothetical protein
MLLRFNILDKSCSVERFSWSHTDSGITHLPSGTFWVCEFLNLGDYSTSTYDLLPPRTCKNRELWWSCMSSSVSWYLPGRSLGAKLWAVQATIRFPLYCSVHTHVMCSSCVRSATSQDDQDSQEQNLFFTTMNFYWITWMLHWICLERCDIRIRQKGWIWQKCRSPKIISYTENQHIQNVLAWTAHLRQFFYCFSPPKTKSRPPYV